MCGIFGYSNYGNTIKDKALKELLNSLSCESASRGTDATGIAFVDSNGKVEIQKAPKSARRFKMKLPDAMPKAVMGHTRHTTQGNEKDNYNNHPFLGHVGNTSFALAHNGIIFNDSKLRQELNLPKTKIETDSYIAVQLLESQKEFSLQSHKYMADKIQGSFVFTTLDNRNNLYITKGSSPVSLIHFKEMGLFIYASTEQILWNAIVDTTFFNYVKKLLTQDNKGKVEFINISDGEILKISADGSMDKCRFDFSDYECGLNWCNYNRSYSQGYYDGISYFSETDSKNWIDFETEYLNDLIQTAASMGVGEEYITMLLEMGVSLEEIEELIYDPAALNQCFDNAIEYDYCEVYP